MKVLRIILTLFWFIPYFGAQDVGCNCYSSGIWPFNKKSDLTFYQESILNNEESQFTVYSPLISSDTIIFKIVPDALLWKFGEQSGSYNKLTEVSSFSEFNVSFSMNMIKRKKLLFFEKIVIEFSPIFDYQTTHAPMLHKIIFNSKKGIKRMIFQQGGKKINCFLPIFSFGKH